MSEDQDTLADRIAFLVPVNKLSADRQARLLEQSDVLELKKKQTLFKQGDRDDYTFYVLDGELEMFADDSLIKRVSGGDGASFQPLAQLQPRQMTATTKTKARILRINRGLLDQLLSMDESPQQAAETGVEVEEMETDADGDWLMTMLQSELFTRIPPSNIQSLLDTLETVSLKAGDNVVVQGEPGDYYYALQSGSCEVVRAGSNNREIRLAELKSGDTFGEEALISGAKRNATVRMLTDGDLARLTKEDFASLIKAPLLSSVDRDEADKLAAGGAVWLDVRFEDEHAHNGLPGSQNIPLGTLRTRMDELDPDTSYIAYCDSGGRSSAAAFLLAEKGFDVNYVEGGAVEEPLPEKPEPAKKKAAEKAPDKAAPKQKAKAETKPQPAPKEKPAAKKQEEPATLEADARASSLTAEVEKATLTIEQAQKLMAEAEAMKAEAEKIVAEKLASEKKKIAAESENLSSKLAEAERREEEAEKRLEDLNTTAEMKREELQQEFEAEQKRLAEEQQKIADEQKKVGQEAEALKAKLAEAEKLKSKLVTQQKAAEAESEQRHREVDEKLAALEAAAEARLEKEKQNLESLYEKQAQQLESMQAEREAELREQLNQELKAERNKLGAEFARTTAELEKAREERQAALQAKEAAAAEAKAMIEEFKVKQEELQAEQQKALHEEREKLRAEAARIEKLREEAIAAREEAETAKARAEAELAEARARKKSAASAPGEDLEIIEIEERAAAADAELDKARQTETVVAEAAKVNEDELERTFDTASEINMLLQKELSDWVDEQDKMQDSTLQREVLSRQKEMVERIKARAAEAAAKEKDRNKSLLDEIEDQLKGS